MPNIPPTSAHLAARIRMYMPLSAALRSPAARPRPCMCATCSSWHGAGILRVRADLSLRAVGLLSEAPWQR